MIDTNKFVHVSRIAGDDEPDTNLLKEMALKAESFLLDKRWCRSVDEQYLGYGIGGVVAVFFCVISPSTAEVDRLLWVVVGDVPSAYLVVEGNPTPSSALEAYVEEMMQWVVAVEQGTSVEKLIPVTAPATPEVAQKLRSRLECLRDSFFSWAREAENNQEFVTTGDR